MSNSNVFDYLKVIEDRKVPEGLLKPFENIIKEEVSGSSRKGCVRAKGSLCGDLYDIINSKNSSFKFSEKGFALSSTKEEFVESYFPAIIKKSRQGKLFADAECIGSRVLELFGISVPYVVPIGDKKDVIVSFNILDQDDSLKTFGEFVGVKIGRNNHIKDWLIVFEKKLKSLDIDDTLKFKLKCDLIKQIILRKFPLLDNDLTCNNIVIIENPNKQIELCGLDFEFCLNNTIVRDLQAELPNNYKNDCFDFLIEECPKEYAYVLETLHAVENRHEKISSICNEFLNDNMALYWGYRINKEIDNMYNKFQDKIDDIKEI